MAPDSAAAVPSMAVLHVRVSAQAVGAYKLGTGMCHGVNAMCSRQLSGCQALAQYLNSPGGRDLYSSGPESESASGEP